MVAGARKSDNSTGLLWNASSAQLGNYPDKYNVMAAISYVTGSHNVKVGLQDAWGPYKRWNTANGDLYQIYNGGSPLQVTVLNTPLQTAEYLDANLGVYVQDSWRLNRFTFNLGLRYDYARQRVMGEPAQTGRFAQSVAYDDIYLPTWTSWSPRTSVVYDLSGVGKTALKFGFNRYETAVTTGFAQIYNPTALTTAKSAWTDLNRDDIAQGERGCTYLTPGCEINFTQLATNFGVRALSVFDPNLERPYQLTYNVGISARAAARHVGVGGVVPQRFQEPDRAEQHGARRLGLHAGHGRTARSTAARSPTTTSAPPSRARCRTSTATIRT